VVHFLAVVSLRLSTLSCTLGFALKGHRFNVGLVVWSLSLEITSIFSVCPGSKVQSSPYLLTFC
jgi:hypothetical protein